MNKQLSFKKQVMFAGYLGKKHKAYKLGLISKKQLDSDVKRYKKTYLR